jgi:hypothetical protein
MVRARLKASLGTKLPQFDRADVALPAWMPLPHDK